MRRGLITIFAVAILGILGLYIKKNDNKTTALAAGSKSHSSQSTTTTANTSNSTASAASPSHPSIKDGTFTGNAADTPYGTVQIAVVISGGKISEVNFLQLPNDQRHSIEVSNAAAPLLKQATLASQSSKIDFVSGATSTSFGYQESLQAALDKAAAS